MNTALTNRHRRLTSKRYPNIRRDRLAVSLAFSLAIFPNVCVAERYGVLILVSPLTSLRVVLAYYQTDGRAHALCEGSMPDTYAVVQRE